RIVLPPRTFASGLAAPTPPAREGAGRIAGAPLPATRNAALPTKFDFPDETFDAIVAWDIFNFYEVAAMRLLAAEARRVLRPGGLLLGYFHARRPDGPDTPRRYRVLDEGRVACDGQPGPPLSRHVYQNRDIEKMFAGLAIVELYFLKNATRELLMEKKAARAAGNRTLVRPATPKVRFTIE
ncbi:MAG: methyltransferase domain-containing protein, partial [Acidobacteriota bacterium]